MVSFGSASEDAIASRPLARMKPVRSVPDHDALRARRVTLARTTASHENIDKKAPFAPCRCHRVTMSNDGEGSHVETICAGAGDRCGGVARVRHSAWAKRRQPHSGEEGPPAVQIGKEKLFPINVNWVADSLDGKQLWSGIDRPSIYIDKQLRMKGFDGCNMFSLTAYPLKAAEARRRPARRRQEVCDKASSSRAQLPQRGARRQGMGYGGGQYADRQRSRRHGALRARALSHERCALRSGEGFAAGSAYP